MLSIQIDRRISRQMENAANWVDTLPNRILQIQIKTLDETSKKLHARLMSLYRAAYALDMDLEPFGPLGFRLRIKPDKSMRQRDHRPDIGAAILLTGKKGGGYIRPRKRKAMQLRDGSLKDGMPEFVKKVRKVAIVSKRNQIRAIAKQVAEEALRNQLAKSGFGPRGSGAGIKDIRMRG